MLLQPISLAFAILGHYRWAHPKKNEENKDNELKITTLTNIERLKYILIVLIFTALWGWFMNMNSSTWPEIFPKATRPFLDAFVVSIILLAQYLSANKKLDCWGVWIMVNITNITLYLSAGLVFLPIVSACYFVLAFFGIRMWLKLKKNQNDVRD